MLQNVTKCYIWKWQPIHICDYLKWDCRHMCDYLIWRRKWLEMLYVNVTCNVGAMLP
jgi:hypothetical protein